MARLQMQLCITPPPIPTAKKRGQFTTRAVTAATSINFDPVVDSTIAGKKNFEFLRRNCELFNKFVTKNWENHIVNIFEHNCLEIYDIAVDTDCMNHKKWYTTFSLVKSQHVKQDLRLGIFDIVCTYSYIPIIAEHRRRLARIKLTTKLKLFDFNFSLKMFHKHLPRSS